MMESMDIKDLNDLDNVTDKQVKAIGGSGLLEETKGAIHMLEKYFPHHDWGKRRKLQWNQKKKLSNPQHFLLKMVEKHFSNEIKVNYHHPQLYFSSLKPVELDIYIPSLNLAFEYQVCWRDCWSWMTLHRESNITTGTLCTDLQTSKRQEMHKREICVAEQALPWLKFLIGGKWRVSC
jgi:hypothetical protein